MGIFSNLFGNGELEELKETTKKWEKVLTPAYLVAWQEWLKKRDVVAAKLNLKEIEIERITCREVIRYAIFSLKRTIGMTDTNKEQISKTRGNTKALQTLRMAMEEFSKYDQLVRKFISIDSFDKEIAKVGNRR